MGPIVTLLISPISMVFSILLTLLGWKLPTHLDMARIGQYKRKVVVFSHTSYWDFWVMMMFMISSPGLFDDIYTVMKPQPFKGIQGDILKHLGFIPSTRKEESGRGFVRKVTRMLRKKDKFLLLVSPKGTIAPVDKWRTGYYYIAKELDVPILAVGFDYEKRKVVVLDYTRVTGKSADEVSRSIIQSMNCIVPLNPEWTLSEVREHNPKDRYPIDYLAALSVLDWCLIYSMSPSDVNLAIALLLYAIAIMVKPITGGMKFTMMLSAFLRVLLYTYVVMTLTLHMNAIEKVITLAPLVILPACTFFTAIEDEMRSPTWYTIDRVTTIAIMASNALSSFLL